MTTDHNEPVQPTVCIAGAGDKVKISVHPEESGEVVLISVNSTIIFTIKRIQQMTQLVVFNRT